METHDTKVLLDVLNGCKRKRGPLCYKEPIPFFAQPAAEYDTSSIEPRTITEQMTAVQTERNTRLCHDCGEESV